MSPLMDLRDAIRALRARPLFAAVAVMTLAIGIAANLTVFSVADALLFRPLPLPAADRLLVVSALRGRDPFAVSAIDVAALGENASTLAGVTAGRVFPAGLAGDHEPEQVLAASADAAFASTLGVEPVLGRMFDADDIREGRGIALLGHGLWQRRFGASEGILGQQILLDGAGYTVAGVLPPGFDLPFEAEIWIPFRIDEMEEPLRRARFLFCFARLADGATLADARREVGMIADDLAAERPDTHMGWSATAVGLRQGLLQDWDGNIRAAVLLLMAGVGLVLLIVCGNVGNMMLTQAIGRAHETGIRIALGAGRQRLFSQMLAEGLLLALGSLALAAPIVYWLPSVLLSMSPIKSDGFSIQLFRPVLDLRLFGFAALVVLGAGLLSALGPAIRSSRSDVADLLAGGGARGATRRGSRRAIQLQAVFQVAMTVVLLAGASLLVEGHRQLASLDVGFRPGGLWSAEVALPEAEYGEQERRNAFVERLGEEIVAQPGIVQAGLTTNIPFDSVSWNSRFECEGRPAPDPASEELLVTSDRLVGPGYLETIGVRLLEGRTIAATDTRTAPPVVVVSEALAETCWPGESGVHRRVRRLSRAIVSDWMTIVGVVASVKEERAAFRRDRPAWYIPYAQVDILRPLRIAARTEGGVGPGSLFRQAVWSVDPDRPVTPATRVETRVSELTATERMSALLMAFFAVTAVLLSGLGIYGTLATGVRERFREIGTRIALGATARDVAGMVVGQGLAVTLAGIAAGTILTLFLTPLVENNVFGAHADPWWRLTAIGAFLALVALVATIVPIRRALRIDPLEVLRAD